MQKCFFLNSCLQIACFRLHDPIPEGLHSAVEGDIEKARELAFRRKDYDGTRHRRARTWGVGSGKGGNGVLFLTTRRR